MKIILVVVLFFLFTSGENIPSSDECYEEDDFTSLISEDGEEYYITSMDWEDCMEGVGCELAKFYCTTEECVPDDQFEDYLFGY